MVAWGGVVNLGSSAIGNSSGSFLTAGVGTPDLVFNVAGTYSNPNNPTAANNGVLQIAGVIKDGANPASLSAGTTSERNIVTVTSTAGSYTQASPSRD